MQKLFGALTVSMTLLGAGRLNAAPLMVDDFETPAPFDLLLIGVDHDNGQPFQQAGVPVTLGGQRDVKVDVLGTPKPNSAQVLIGHEGDLFNKGVFQVATASDPGSVVTLQYDGQDDNVEELTNSHGLLATVLADGGVTIDFLSVDAPVAGNLDVLVRLYSEGAVATYSGQIGESGDPSSLFAPYSEFDVGDGFSFDAVDSFEFVFNSPGQVDVDFVVDQIWTVVPEPSTWFLGAIALAVIGCGACGRR